MGGIVAAETVLSILADKPISSSHGDSSEHHFMFPYIQALLSFDTPYLGIAPGVLAHGAEGHWNQASAAYNAYSTVANAFGWGGGSGAKAAVDAKKMLPAAPSAADVDVATAPAWQRWGKYAMFAGAAGAVAAGGAAAWMNRDTLSEGWKWAGSHLEFVGVLAKGAELQKRLASVVKLEEEVGLGFVDIYTCLGQAVDGKSEWFSGTLGEERTFCTLPGEKSELRRYFVPAVNDMATAEVWAHTSMFKAKENPGYHHLVETARNIIVSWANTAWYEDGEVVSGTEREVQEENIEDSEIVESEEAEEDFETNFETVDDGAQDAWRN